MAEALGSAVTNVAEQEIQGLDLLEDVVRGYGGEIDFTDLVHDERVRKGLGPKGLRKALNRGLSLPSLTVYGGNLTVRLLNPDDLTN
jgi:hypothetical protein